MDQGLGVAPGLKAFQLRFDALLPLVEKGFDLGAEGVELGVRQDGGTYVADGHAQADVAWTLFLEEGSA